MITSESRIENYCTPAIWWVMDEGQQWRLYKLQGSRIQALVVFLEFAIAMHYGELGRLYD